MTREEVEAWDQRYADGSYVARPGPTPFLAEWLPRVPVGRALDLATGTGRNALLLAEHGFEVEAVDGSSVAIDRARAEAERRGLDVTWRVADLDTHDVGTAAWDLVTVVRYRNEALWPRLVDALAPDGWIVVEHHLVTDLDVGGPASERFRLRPQELLEAFGELRVVHYSEGVEAADDRDAHFAIARLVACRGNPGF